VSPLTFRLVKNFFEIRSLTVHVHRRPPSSSPGAMGAERADLIVINPHPKGRSPSEVVLGAGDISRLSAAVVHVACWHASTFFESAARKAVGVYEFARPATLEKAASQYGLKDPAPLIVISKLPASGEARKKTLEFLKRRNIRYVMEFGSILSHLIREIDGSASYPELEELELLRLLKRYGFVKDGQFEFKFRSPPTKTKRK